MNIHHQRMMLALEEAKQALMEGEVPVGAVLFHHDDLIASAHNTREQTGDPTAHAELLCLRQGAKVLGKRRLQDCTLYVTLEPCPMCAGAMIMACLGHCYFGASDVRQGCVESLYALPQDPSFYHHVSCVGGVLADPASDLLTRFFHTKRNPTKEDPIF